MGRGWKIDDLMEDIIIKETAVEYRTINTSLAKQSFPSIICWPENNKKERIKEIFLYIHKTLTRKNNGKKNLLFKKMRWLTKRKKKKSKCQERKSIFFKKKQLSNKLIDKKRRWYYTVHSIYKRVSIAILSLNTNHSQKTKLCDLLNIHLITMMRPICACIWSISVK